jgi:hypothetical protein
MTDEERRTVDVAERQQLRDRPRRHPDNTFVALTDFARIAPEYADFLRDLAQVGVGQH